MNTKKQIKMLMRKIEKAQAAYNSVAIARRQVVRDLAANLQLLNVVEESTHLSETTKVELTRHLRLERDQFDIVHRRCIKAVGYRSDVISDLKDEVYDLGGYS